MGPKGGLDILRKKSRPYRKWNPGSLIMARQRWNYILKWISRWNGRQDSIVSRVYVNGV